MGTSLVWVFLIFLFIELRQCSLYNESSTSQHHCTTTMTLNSASGITSLSMNQSEDEQIIDLQNRLQCRKNIPVRKRRFFFFFEKYF